MGFSQPRWPKIAVPTRTWVAPSSMAVVKSALIPMDRSETPLRCAIFAVSAKWGAGGSSAGGMAAATGQERIRFFREHARLLRLAAGIDLDKQQGLACLPCNLLGERCREAVPIDRMDGVKQGDCLSGLV